MYELYVKEIPKRKYPEGALQKSQAINRTAFDKYISLTIKYTEFLLAKANARARERVELSRATDAPTVGEY